MSTSAAGGLARVVSRWEVVALAVNDVIGSGVYLVLPVAAATLLGAASIWAILGAGVAVLLLVLCFAEAGSRFEETGGAYLYTRAAFGDLAGFEIGWMTWIARVASVAGLSGYFARAVGYLWSAAGEGAGRWVTTFAALVGLTLINMRGVKASARTAVVLTLGKTLPLALLVAVGIFAIDPHRLFPIPMPPRAGLWQATLLVVFAYSGFENAPVLAGELQNPRRDVPFALVVTIGLVTAIYTLVQLVAIGTVPNLGESPTPLAHAARELIGPAGGLILTVGAVLSVLGTLNNTILCGPRYLLALAEDGFLPAAFARLHPRYRTPSIAILVQTLAAMALLVTNTADQLAELSVVARLATYAGTAASVPILRRKMPRTDKTIQLPGGPLIPLAALAICAVFVAAATPKNLIAGAIALAAGAVVFYLRRRR